MNKEAAEAFSRALKTTGQTEKEKLALFDKESGKVYRIEVTVEDVPSYLKESFRDYDVKISAGGAGGPCPKCGGSGRV